MAEVAGLSFFHRDPLGASMGARAHLLETAQCMKWAILGLGDVGLFDAK